MTGMLPGLESEADRRAAEPDKRDREDDPTPRELVRAIIEAAGPHIVRHCESPSRALDVCAGYGVWASEWRRWWMRSQWASVPLHVTGVELCEARRPHLRKWCNRVMVGDWFDALRDWHDLPRFDVAIGNPHFSALVGKRDRDSSEVADMLADPLDPALSMPAVLLEHAPAVLLYHTRNAFVRNEPGRAVWRAYPPARVFVVPGTVSHDGTSSVASDCYQVSLWIRDHRGPTIEQLLDVEPKAANLAAGIVKSNGEPYSCWRWRGEPPGSEEPSDDLPGVVRGDS